MGTRDYKTLLRDHGYLGISLIYLSIMAVSAELFESVSVETVAELDKILNWKDQSALPNEYGNALLIEIRARYFWLTFALANIIVPLYAGVVSMLIIFKCHSGKRLKIVLMVMLAICIANLCTLYYYAYVENAIYRLVYGVTNHLLTHSGRFEQAFLHTVRSIVGVINVLAFFVPTLIAFAFASTIAPSQSVGAPTLIDLSKRMRYLKTILYVASAFLVIGTLHMAAWLQWPSTLIADSELKSNFLEAALSIATYWGSTFALMLFLTFSPAAAYLSGKARYIVQHHREQIGDDGDSDIWLEKHNLSINLGDQIPQLIAVLAPALVGPIESLLTHSA